MSLTQKTMSAAVWTFGSIIAQAVLQIVVTAILAHYIPPSGFGLFAITSLVIGMISLFAQIGLGPTVVQRKDLTDQFIAGAYLISFGLGLISFILIWFASPLIASFFKEPGVVDLLRASSVVIIISGYTTIATSLLQRDLLFRKVAIINVVSYIIGYGLIGCTLAVVRVDAWAIVGASLTQNLIIAIMLLGSRKLPHFSFSRSTLKDILTFGAGVSLAQIFANIANYLDNAIVGRFIGTTALGLYQMAFQIMDLPRRFLGNVIDQILFVVMSKVQDDQERMRAGYLQSIEIANLMLVPITALMICATPELVNVILGDKWVGAILPLQILLTQVPLRASVRMADSISTAAGKVYRLARFKALYTIMIGVAALIGVTWNLTGVAITVTIAVIANWILMVWFTLQIVKASAREYLATWRSALLVGFFVTAATALGSIGMRQVIGSDLIRLILVAAIAAVVFIGMIILWPGLVGSVTLRMVLDYGKRLPLVSGVFVWAEKNIFAKRIPALNS